MQKNEQLEDDETLFKAIEEEKTCIKVESQASTKFAITKLYSKF